MPAQEHADHLDGLRSGRDAVEGEADEIHPGETAWRAARIQRAEDGRVPGGDAGGVRALLDTYRPRRTRSGKRARVGATRLDLDVGRARGRLVAGWEAFVDLLGRRWPVRFLCVRRAAARVRRIQLYVAVTH